MSRATPAEPPACRLIEVMGALGLPTTDAVVQQVIAELGNAVFVGFDKTPWVEGAGATKYICDRAAGQKQHQKMVDEYTEYRRQHDAARDAEGDAAFVAEFKRLSGGIPPSAPGRFGGRPNISGRLLDPNVAEDLRKDAHRARDAAMAEFRPLLSFEQFASVTQAGK
jgi:hypothetical protein